MLTIEVPAAVPEEVKSDDMRDMELKPEKIDAEKLHPDEGTNGLGICLLYFFFLHCPVCCFQVFLMFFFTSFIWA